MNELMVLLTAKNTNLQGCTEEQSILDSCDLSQLVKNSAVLNEIESEGKACQEGLPKQHKPLKLIRFIRDYTRVNPLRMKLVIRRANRILLKPTD